MDLLRPAVGQPSHQNPSLDPKNQGDGISEGVNTVAKALLAVTSHLSLAASEPSSSQGKRSWGEAILQPPHQRGWPTAPRQGPAISKAKKCGRKKRDEAGGNPKPLMRIASGLDELHGDQVLPHPLASSSLFLPVNSPVFPSLQSLKSLLNS